MLIKETFNAEKYQQLDNVLGADGIAPLTEEQRETLFKTAELKVLRPDTLTEPEVTYRVSSLLIHGIGKRKYVHLKVVGRLLTDEERAKLDEIRERLLELSHDVNVLTQALSEYYATVVYNDQWPSNECLNLLAEYVRTLQSWSLKGYDDAYLSLDLANGSRVVFGRVVTVTHLGVKASMSFTHPTPSLFEELDAKFTMGIATRFADAFARYSMNGRAVTDELCKLSEQLSKQRLSIRVRLTREQIYSVTLYAGTREDLHELAEFNPRRYAELSSRPEDNGHREVWYGWVKDERYPGPATTLDEAALLDIAVDYSQALTTHPIYGTAFTHYLQRNLLAVVEHAKTRGHSAPNDSVYRVSGGFWLFTWNAGDLEIRFVPEHGSSVF